MCNSPTGAHYEIVIQGEDGAEIGTCKYCKNIRHYKKLNWVDLYNKFNLDKPTEIAVLTWGPSSRRERALRGTFVD